MSHNLFLCDDVPGWRLIAYISTATFLHGFAGCGGGKQRRRLPSPRHGQQDQQIDGRDRADREHQAIVFGLERAESLVSTSDVRVLQGIGFFRAEVFQDGVAGALGSVHAVERERGQLGPSDVDQREQGQDLRDRPGLQPQQDRVRGRQEDPRSFFDYHVCNTILLLYFARIYFATRV